ncbi:MAG: 16S rRNA (adenine(1518)-N(6)/adenine(1519)-N(6))-dimethyltransferase RsmA [Patescibacteria group bacterium]|nr:16S rRNA (adenine(1518)-N(6)/adenine(1519)-N(6))-dimethyltransferase RsmA [Patescibacteria group bacterium]
MGQNFLVDQKVLDKIIKTAEINADDAIVEIGPGLGVLTEELGKRAKLVLAIEKDFKLCDFLRKRFKSQKNIKIIHADILHFEISNFQFPISKQFNNLTMQQPNHYKVVVFSFMIANLPYNITSPVIRKFLEGSYQLSVDSNQLNANCKLKTVNCKLESMVLMVQKEVAERIYAKPGNSERGILTVMVEFYASSEIVEIVNRNSFWPVPSVDSAIIKLKTNSEKLKTTTKNLKMDPNVFFRVVKAGFGQKRRQIHHPLETNLYLEKSQVYDILKKAKIEPTLRAEDLSLEDWIRLYQQINKLT